ncbi:MAG: UTP--glucose-1-phosphate uridylyltransferase, partial [Myxococcota bacterium]
MQYSKAFQAFAQKLEHDQAPTLFVQAFHQLYDALQKGERGILPESQIQPAREIPQQSELPTSLCEVGTQALQATVQIRLNGGLGTSMGMKQAKTLLPLKQTSNFLDLIIAQSQALHIPLLLMNSFATQHDTLVQLDKYPQLNASIPQLQATFLQHRAPKVCAQTLQPIESDTHPELTWCPPGHGDLFTALTTSGLLEQLLAHKIQYAFLSNADNLGAFVDTQLLGYFVQQQIPFMMEVTQRTPADRKGGHLAKSKQGQLLLRESAQCPEQDQEDFQNIDKHRYFNTNNLWV